MTKLLGIMHPKMSGYVKHSDETNYRDEQLKDTMKSGIMET